MVLQNSWLRASHSGGYDGSFRTLASGTILKSHGLSIQSAPQSALAFDYHK